MIPVAVLAAAFCVKLYGPLEGEKKKICEEWATQIVQECKEAGDFYVPKVVKATREYVEVICVEEKPKKVKA